MSPSSAPRGFLDSRVGRRLVLLFAVCALLPLVSLAILSHRAVREYLLSSGIEELRDGSKAYAMSLVDRLDLLEAVLRDAAVGRSDEALTAAQRTLLADRFSQVGRVTEEGSSVPLLGPPLPAVDWQRVRAEAGATEAVLVVSEEGPMMAVFAESAVANAEVVAGRISAEFLWWGVTRENTMPANTELAVLVGGRTVFSTVAVALELGEELAVATANGARGLRWSAGDEVYVAGYWRAPLGARFGTGAWTVAWSRPERAVLQPVEHFGWLFGLIFSVTLLAVLCLALWQIRRLLIPLERLREGTRRIARRDFATPVQVTTDDEFGDLATSFNEMAERLEHLIEDLRRHQLGTLRALARAIDERSSWTLGHSGRVARLAHRLGLRLGLAPEDLWDLHRAALLHDIGKLSVDSMLLNRAGPLTADERRLLEAHVESGLRILEPVPGYDRIRPIVAQHHERLDGSGYPEGLEGDEIGLSARILAVADSFDALSSDRPYRAGLALDEVLAELRRGSEALYDPAVVDVLEEILAEEGTGADTWPGGIPAEMGTNAASLS